MVHFKSKFLQTPVQSGVRANREDVYSRDCAHWKMYSTLKVGVICGAMGE